MKNFRMNINIESEKVTLSTYEGVYLKNKVFELNNLTPKERIWINNIISFGLELEREYKKNKNNV